MSFKQNIVEKKETIIQKIKNAFKKVYSFIFDKFNKQILINVIRQGGRGRLLSPGTNYENNTRRSNRYETTNKKNNR